jgi:hypothetical protein
MPKEYSFQDFDKLFGIDEKEFKKLDHITFNNAKKILTPLVKKNIKQFNALVDRQKALFKKHFLEKLLLNYQTSLILKNIVLV